MHPLISMKIGAEAENRGGRQPDLVKDGLTQAVITN